MRTFDIPSDLEYLKSKGLSAEEAERIIQMAYEYAKPNKGKWRDNT